MADVYGLRFHTISISLGTSLSFFVPDEDMPIDQNERGYELLEDIIETGRGNKFIYEKGEYRQWHLIFEAVSERTKSHIEHCVRGWRGSQQITVVAFGTSVIGTSESMASMATAGQIYGTGYLRITSGKPKERMLDMWDFEVLWTEFGPDQSFT